MTKLTKDDVMHVARLAKLEIDDLEITKYTSQLSSVLAHFEELSEVDTKGVESTSQTTGLINVLREDNVVGSESLTQEQAVSGTDRNHNGYFKVKAILEERTDK